MNLMPPRLAHRISYRVMNWAGLIISIPVVINMGHGIDSHINDNPKVCKNLGRSNWFPGKLIIGVMESDVWSS